MSEQPYKAIFHHSWTSAQERAQHWTRVAGQVGSWLIENGRRSHYVMRYVNVDDLAGTSEMVVVLNDRNTALMLKLALA